MLFSLEACWFVLLLCMSDFSKYFNSSIEHHLRLSPCADTARVDGGFSCSTFTRAMRKTCGSISKTNIKTERAAALSRSSGVGHRHRPSTLGILLRYIWIFVII